MTAVSSNYVHVHSDEPQPETITTVGSTEPLPLPTNEPELVAYGNVMLRALRDNQGELAANDAAEDVEHKRIDNEYEDVNRPLLAQQEWLTRELERIAVALRPFFRGKKSRNL